jgi:hypothetical protein
MSKLIAVAIVLLLSAAPGALAQSGGGGVAPQPSSAQPETVKTGYLSCHVSSGWGIIFGSSRDLDCTYTPNSGQPEHYKGEITKFGADIGYLQSGVIIWAVLAPSRITVASALSAHYAGATASATLGVGGVVNVLVGGMHSSITLQPISIEGNNGLNVAAGVAMMNLHYVFPPQTNGRRSSGATNAPAPLEFAVRELSLGSSLRARAS